MTRSSQSRAVANYRNRLAERGLVRFEVTGREADRELVRALARHLAEGGPAADRLRLAVTQGVSGAPRKGGIVRALLASPLAGSGIDLGRPREDGRATDL